MVLLPLFHVNNTFTIEKKNGEMKTICFSGHKVGLYYKLYSILCKSGNYIMKTATITTITGRTLMSGNFMDIFDSLIDELKKEHRYSVVVSNSSGGNVYHWRNTENEVLETLVGIEQKFTSTNDVRLTRKVKVIDNHTGEIENATLNVLIADILSKKETEVEEPETEVLGVYLEFGDVLKDMRPLITNGTDKEKIGAKAILAYVAAKLAEK